MEFKNTLVVVALSAGLLLNSSTVFAGEQPSSRVSVVARSTGAAALAAYAVGTYFYNEGSAAGSAVAGTALITAAAVAPVSVTDTAKAVFNWVAGKIATFKAARTPRIYLMPVAANVTAEERNAALVRAFNRMDEEAEAECRALSVDGYEEGEISDVESELEEGEICE